MTAIALRNLGERKLRTVLTSLAIVLGVMMVAGTYVLTDTIDRVVRRHLHPVERGHRRGRPDPSGRRDRRRPGAPVPGEGARPGRARSTGSAPRRARSPTSRCRSSAPTASPRGGNGAPSFGFSARAEAVRPAHLRRGRARRRPTTRSSSTRRRPTTRASRSATRSRSRARRRPRPTRSSGIATLGDVDSFGGATHRPSSPCRRRSGSPARRASSTRSSSPPHRGVDPGAARREPEGGAAELARGPRPAPQNVQSQRDDVSELHRLSQDRAADLRRRRPVRRRLPDLQHLLDHGRPAHARVRDAAHAGREPPPDPHLGDRRGVRRSGCAPRSSASAPGSASRSAIKALFQALGHRPARQPAP